VSFKSVYIVNYAVKNNGTLPFRLFFGCKGKAIYFINQIFGRKNDEWFKKTLWTVTNDVHCRLE